MRAGLKYALFLKEVVSSPSAEGTIEMFRIRAVGRRMWFVCGFGLCVHFERRSWTCGWIGWMEWELW